MTLKLPVYRCFWGRRRMAPPGLNYVESWVEANFDPGWARSVRCKKRPLQLLVEFAQLLAGLCSQ